MSRSEFERWHPEPGSPINRGRSRVVGLAAAVGLGALLGGCHSGGKTGSYHWVRGKNTSKVEHAAQGSIALESPRGSTVETPDQQALVVLPKGGVPAHGEDNGVRIVIDSLDAATLGSLPAGWVADGNAYRVEMKYLPSGAPVRTLGQQTSFDKIIKLLVEMAAAMEPSEKEIDPSSPGAKRVLLFSPKGTNWKRVDASFSTLDPHPRAFLAVSLTQLGIYLPAIRHDKKAADPPRLGSPDPSG